MTKWVDEEIILAYVYSKKFGMKTSKKQTDYEVAISAFANIQGRNIEQAKGTLSQKLRNFTSWFNGDESNSGGLNRPSNAIHRILKTHTLVELEEIYNKLVHKGLKATFSIFSALEDDHKPKNKSSNKKISDVKDNKVLIKELPGSSAEVIYKNAELRDYLREIKNSNYKVPVFQREFIWKPTQIVEFLNALLKGFPFGNIVVWENDGDALKERNQVVQDFRTKDSIRESALWLLDGQQRTSSVISALTKHDSKWSSKKLIFSFEVMSFKVLEKDDVNFVSAAELLNEEVKMTILKKNHGINDAGSEEMLEELRDRILRQQVGVTVIKNASLETAIDIFAAINTKGKKLTLFDIINAKWHSENIKFNLEEFYKDYKSNNGLSCIDEVIILKTIYLCLDKTTISQKSIMQLEITQDHLKLMDKIATSQRHANDFLVNDMGFKSELMPSINLFKFITYAFFSNDNKVFNKEKLSNLKKYVRYVCLTNMYSSSTEAKLVRNLEDVDKILRNEPIEDLDRKVEIDDILKTSYSENSSKYYFILNALFANARSLKNDSRIPVTSSEKKNSSINIHHIVPKSLSFDGKKVIEMKYGNSLANLAPIREDENQQISNNLPSDYYKHFLEENSNVDETLKDLIIDPTILKGIDQNATKESLLDFWETRASEIVSVINNEMD